VIVSEALFADLWTADEVAAITEAVQFVGQPGTKQVLVKFQLKNMDDHVVIRESAMGRMTMPDNGAGSFKIV
jgi:hypothetical protein